MLLPLVGRSAELALLAGAIDDAAAGRGGLLVVAGEAGIGKSRLVTEAARAAVERGLVVLTGRSVEGAATPLRAVAEALLAAFRDRPPPDDPALAPFRAALAPLVPEWRTPDGAQPAESLVRNEGVLRLLRAIGGARGCLLVLEDVHWAEPETLSVIDHLAAHAGSQRVLCLATVRDEPGRPRFPAREIRLERLADADVVELARHAYGGALDPADERVLCQRAEGLPLVAEDLVATSRTTAAPVADVVPLTFAGMVQRRLAALGDDAIGVLRAAALLGRRFDWRLLPDAAGVDVTAVGGILRRAVDAQLVAAEPDGGFVFRHALLRDAVLVDLLPFERAEPARRLLAAVTAAHPGVPGEWCEVAADLAAAAGDASHHAELLLESARRGVARGALATAEATLDRLAAAGAGAGHALELDLLRLEVASLAGKTELALRLGDDLLARLGDEHPDAAGVHLRLARAAAAASRWDDALRHVADVHRLAPPGSDLPVRADALAAAAAITTGRTDDAVELATRAVASPYAGSAPEAVCEAYEVLGRVARRVDFERAEHWFGAAAETARAAGLRLWEIRALHELGTVDMLRSSRLDRLEQARQLATEAGALSIAAVVDLQLAGSYAVRFEADAALRAAGRGIEVAELFDLGLTLPALLAQSATAHGIAGRRTEMEEHITRAAALSRDHPDIWAVAWGHARGFAALLWEDRATAYEAFRHGMRWAARPDCGIAGAIEGWVALVGTLDDVDGAGGVTVRDEVRGGSAMVVDANRALLAMADAIALGRAGEAAGAEAAVAQAEPLLRRRERYDGWLHLSRRLLAEPAIDEGWGDPAGWLREGLVWFEATGHTAAAGACRRLLSRAGAPVPRRGRGDSEVPAELRARGVTSREADVLWLLGDGLSNADIAARLFLSGRTVEKHVERLRDKTGAASRAALAQLAAKYGPPGR